MAVAVKEDLEAAVIDVEDVIKVERERANEGEVELVARVSKPVLQANGNSWNIMICLR